MARRTGGGVMAKLISMTYEQARAEHFKALKDKAEVKTIYWSARANLNRPYDLNDPAHIKASEYGVECSYYKDALEALKNQPKWFSVEEKLPRDNQIVLACGTKGGMKVVRFCRCGSYNDWKFMGTGKYTKPKWWMPMPESPKEGT